MDPKKPYSERDDIIVISDEAHRTQAGRLARNMRLALPNAAFIGFTGTPLFKQDEITKRIFGDYVSRYDFKRSEEDGATVKLVYENRGEKLGVAAPRSQRAASRRRSRRPNSTPTRRRCSISCSARTTRSSPPTSGSTRSRPISSSTARRDGNPASRCSSASTRSPAPGCTSASCRAGRRRRRRCGRPPRRSRRKRRPLPTKPRAQRCRRGGEAGGAGRLARRDDHRDHHQRGAERGRRLQEVGLRHHPASRPDEAGLRDADGKRVDVETAFKDPKHPFRVAIVCAMWLTGFDVECLSTLYIDKPMKAHTLMQAIARANRVYPGKDFGLIVDYNGMLKSLRAALAQYALGDDGTGGEEIVAPIEERVQALDRSHRGDRGASARPRLRSRRAASARRALRASRGSPMPSRPSIRRDEAKRRFEILARQVFIRFKALLMEPTAFAYAERHDNIEAIYKKLTERRDTADVTELLKELHRIVNEAIRTQAPGDDQAEGLTFDLSQIDLEKLREEFAKKVRRKATALQDIRDIVEQKLAEMLARNPTRMDYQLQI